MISFLIGKRKSLGRYGHSICGSCVESSLSQQTTLVGSEPLRPFTSITIGIYCSCQVLTCWKTAIRKCVRYCRIARIDLYIRNLFVDIANPISNNPESRINNNKNNNKSLEIQWRVPPKPSGPLSVTYTWNTWFTWNSPKKEILFGKHCFQGSIR